jgi:hypothetical protein
MDPATKPASTPYEKTPLGGLLNFNVPRPRNLSFLDHRDRVVDVNCPNLVPARRPHLLTVIPAVHVIDHVFDKLDS